VVLATAVMAVIMPVARRVAAAVLVRASRADDAATGERQGHEGGDDRCNESSHVILPPRS
jgi:hypothetical protein